MVISSSKGIPSIDTVPEAVVSLNGVKTREEGERDVLEESAREKEREQGIKVCPVKERERVSESSLEVTSTCCRTGTKKRCGGVEGVIVCLHSLERIQSDVVDVMAAPLNVFIVRFALEQSML